MSLGRYTDARPPSSSPASPRTPQQRNGNAPDAGAEEFAFPCGCVTCTSATGSYTIAWCPYHDRAHGDIRELAVR